MKILFADTTIHEALIGGGHLYLPGLMKGLVNNGHEVHLAVSGPPNERVATFIRESGAIVHEYPWHQKGLVADMAPLFAKWVNDLSPDIFVISASADMAWVALPLLNGSIATAAIAHNDEETFYLPIRHYQRFLTGAVGVSPEICDSFITQCNMPAELTRWIPYGVTTSPLPPSAKKTGSLHLIYAGRVVEEQKRISDVVAIARELTARKTDYHLTIVGDGPEIPMVKKELAMEIDNGVVELKGWLPNDEVIDAFRNSELFLLTSAYEGFCISLIESMANGCCSVVSEIRSGNKDLVENGVSGYRCAIGAVNAFADIISGLAADPERLSALRLKAWKKGQQFSTLRMVEGYEAFFNDCKVMTVKSPRVPILDFPLMATCTSAYPLWLRRIKFRLRHFLH